MLSRSLKVVLQGRCSLVGCAAGGGGLLLVVARCEVVLVRVRQSASRVRSVMSCSVSMITVEHFTTT